METFIYKIIFLFFFICWVIFQTYIIDITTGTKQSRNVMWKIVFLGICAFLSGVCMGNLM